jgi:hypothetical protein
MPLISVCRDDTLSAASAAAFHSLAFAGFHFRHADFAIFTFHADIRCRHFQLSPPFHFSPAPLFRYAISQYAISADCHADIFAAFIDYSPLLRHCCCQLSRH